MFTFSQFNQYEKLKYGFSVRQDGSMHRHLEKDNRRDYFEKIGIDQSRVVTADLAQGVNVKMITDDDAGMMISNTDALITAAKNVFLSATAADCFLLYFYDPAKDVVGIAHVGWKGLLAGVIKNTIDALISDGGASINNILVGISPGIRKCHFEISSADLAKFNDYPKCINQRNGTVFVDLPGIIISQLLGLGIAQEYIEDSGICTYCDTQDYFSYRRDKPSVVQPMVGYIGLLP